MNTFQRTCLAAAVFASTALAGFADDLAKLEGKWTTKNDPRRLRVGAFMRAWNIDEVPQFWNVLKGDMSLVGPRPERPEMLEKIQQDVPGFPMRLKVRAGMTGWAQVNGFRGRTSFRKRLQYDLYYLKNFSIGLDFMIMLETVKVVFKQRGGR